jgi:hypothetical protein
MAQFIQSLQAWNTPAFARTLKQEIENLPCGALPLYHCTRQGGMVDDTDISASILNSRATQQAIEVKLGIFFSERVGGCSCHDEPVLENAYGEMLLSIDRQTADAEITVLDD